MMFIELMALPVPHPDTYIRYEASHLSTSMSAFPTISHRLTAGVMAVAALYSFVSPHHPI